MKKLILAACLMCTPAVAAAQNPSYDECRQIVATHSFMMEMKKDCEFQLREDTSNLAYACTSALNKFHRDLAIQYGKEMAKKYRTEYRGATCKRTKGEFAPLLQD